MVDIEPHSGLLTNRSVYLKYHYVVLNQGEGNFGLHSGAVLLDPVNTSGTNIFLEISVDVCHSPTFDIAKKKAPKAKSEKLYVNLKQVYHQLDGNPKAHFSSVRPTTWVSVSGRSTQTPNQSLLNRPFNDREGKGTNEHFGHRTIGKAIRKGETDSGTLSINHFINLTEHTEILSRFQRLKLRRLKFQNTTLMQDFLQSSEA